jgi:hypothetical protein
MSFLYRAALTITRKQPYIDWANSQGDGGPELTAELANDRRTIYLVPESSDIARGATSSSATTPAASSGSRWRTAAGLRLAKGW